MKKLILPIIFAFVTILFFSFLTPQPIFAFLGIGESSSEFDCQKFWESLSDDDGLTIGGPRQGSISNVSGWKFSSKKKTVGRTSGDSCDIGGIRYDTDDSEGEAKTGFEINVSYFQNQEEAGVKIGSLKAGEEVEVEDKNVSGDTYSMKTLKLMTLGYDSTTVGKRENFLAPGNYGRTVGRVGNCVITLTHTWYALAYQTTGDNNESQVAKMDEVMGMTQEGWRALSEAKDVQQFCGKNAESGQPSTQKTEPEPQTANEKNEEKTEQKQTENQLFINVPNTVIGWLNFLGNLGKARLALFLDPSEFLSLAGGSDHSLCDPESCARAEDIANGEKGKYERELLRDRFNETLRRAENGDPWPFLKDVEIGSDGKPILIKAPMGAFEIKPFNKQKGILEYRGNTPVLKSGQLEVFEENKGSVPTTIETPNAELFVIGTHFLLFYDQEGKYTALTVYEGKVEVKPKGSSNSKVVSPDGDKPGVILVTSKPSTTKTAIVGVVLVASIGGIALFIKRKFALRRVAKKRK